MIRSTTFLGADLAWAVEKRTSAIAVLRGDANGAELVALSGPIIGSSRVVEFIAGQSSLDSVMAVDASLVVTNPTGQRACEKQVSQRFGARGASCHSTSLAKGYARTGMQLVQDLSLHGFTHDFDLSQARQRPGRWLFEVYPHPAMIQLWGLPRIIPYKKGSVAQKRMGLATLVAHLHRLCAPPFGLLENELLRQTLGRNLPALRGQRLKDHEDTLDALFCAYLAWHCWRWGAERSEMIGTLENGYIVVPKASD